MRVVIKVLFAHGIQFDGRRLNPEGPGCRDTARGYHWTAGPNVMGAKNATPDLRLAPHDAPCCYLEGGIIGFSIFGNLGLALQMVSIQRTIG